MMKRMLLRVLRVLPSGAGAMRPSGFSLGSFARFVVILYVMNLLALVGFIFFDYFSLQL